MIPLLAISYNMLWILSIYIDLLYMCKTSP